MKATYERKVPKVPVGSTPRSKYATWDDHRRAIKQASDDARAMRSGRRSA